jgi:hypothetical protein
MRQQAHLRGLDVTRVSSRLHARQVMNILVNGASRCRRYNDSTRTVCVSWNSRCSALAGLTAHFGHRERVSRAIVDTCIGLS